MATKLFVGGLAYSVNDDQLKDLFAAAGTVVSAQVIVDKYSNQSKGFGFVEMSSEEEAKKAIDELNGKDFEGRSIAVNEARPQERREPRSFGGGGGGGGGHRNDYHNRDDRRY
jgi:RNA recognition motif-containing protein